MVQASSFKAREALWPAFPYMSGILFALPAFRHLLTATGVQKEERMAR